MLTGIEDQARVCDALHTPLDQGPGSQPHAVYDLMTPTSLPTKNIDSLTKDVPKRRAHPRRAGAYLADDSMRIIPDDSVTATWHESGGSGVLVLHCSISYAPIWMMISTTCSWTALMILANDLKSLCSCLYPPFLRVNAFLCVRKDGK
jgi:hypothetical protein